MAAPNTHSTAPARGPFDVHPAVRLLTETFLYKFSWPKLLGSNLILGIALLVSVSVNVALALRKADPVYFAVTADGRITRLAPLSEPLVSPEEVVQFAQNCVTRSFSLDFVADQLRNKLESLHDCYTDEGFHALMSAFDKSNLLTKIRDGRLVSSAVATGAGVIAAIDAHDPRGYKWTVQQPISITLVNQTERRSYSFIIETHIQRVPTVDNPKGISTTALQIIGNGQNN
jgi:intracellular multiplication protein IcmL